MMDGISSAVVDFVGAFGPVLRPFCDPIEASARKLAADVPNLLAKYDAALSAGHPLSSDFPLMNPFHVVLIIFGYLFMIVVGRLVMDRKKEPFSPFTIQVVHNAFLVVVSAYMAIECIRQAFFVNHMKIVGNSMDSSATGLARIVWIFYFSKIIEFGDTFIMILKKNYRQISFLHVYHHTTIFFIWWMVTFYGPGGEAFQSVILNSTVHVVMYLYYFTSSLQILEGFRNRVKHYITFMQITQFMIMLVQSIYNLLFAPDGYQRFLSLTLFWYMLTLLALFFNFLVNDRKRLRDNRAERDKKKKR